MAKIKAKQIDLTGVGAAGNGSVRFRIPVGETLLVADGHQYVVHRDTFEVEGEVDLDGDAELIVDV